MGGPATLLVDEPSYFYILTTHLSYMILIAFGRVRDFFGKVFKREKYKGFKEQDGYAALNSDWENFYFRRLKARMNDCFSRPYGLPS
jgi:serine palmitoyltransferase